MINSPNFIISTQNLTKSYGKKRIVDGLNMTIPCGSVCGFLGSNGAGKTTTSKMLLGLVKPSKGQGKIFGKNIVQDSLTIRQKVGFLSQSPNFYSYLTARETLRFVASFFFQDSRYALETHIEQYLELVGLSSKADRRVSQFSGGERQRLGIAQAAINEPELIILDEPASALDPLGRRDVLKILESFRGRSTVFYSTHILDDVQRVSDWVVIIQQGRLVTQGAISKLLTGKYNLFKMTVQGDGLKEKKRLEQISWIDHILVDTGTPDIEGKQITKLQIQVSDPLAAENELLRIVLTDSTAIVTQFERSINSLEDVFINLVEAKNKYDS